MILLTGATGYVGGRLLQELQKAGHRVRCLARRPEFLRSQVAPSVEIIGGDVLDPASLAQALEGIDVAYYLIHSMGAGEAFEEMDRRGARNFAEAARNARLRRIIYLGGLGNDKEDLSPHLRSRHEVGELLRSSGVPVVELRASIVIGSGSLSFELIRALVDRLPVMITPQWVSMAAQPIAIDDLLSFLRGALTVPIDGSRVFEIGGADRVSYAEIMRAYARMRGRRLVMIPVPVLTPFLSSLWLGLVTPLYARIGRTLVESIVHSTVVRDTSAASAFGIRPRGMESALQEALAGEEREIASTRWSSALSSGAGIRTWAGVRFGSRLVDSRTIRVDVPASAAFTPIRRIGGRTGWYAWNVLWRIRGALDLLAGGVGMRRGRPLEDDLRVGDPLDFWRVEAYEADHLLRLTAEMKLPGRAWLEFEVTGEVPPVTVRQTAIFDPVGLFGLIYWYALYPLHRLVFAGMLEGIATRAREVRGQRSIHEPRRSE